MYTRPQDIENYSTHSVKVNDLGSFQNSYSSKRKSDNDQTVKQAMDLTNEQLDVLLGDIGIRGGKNHENSESDMTAKLVEGLTEQELQEILANIENNKN